MLNNEALKIISEHRAISKTEMAMAYYSDEALIDELVSIVQELKEEIEGMYMDAAGEDL